MAGAIDRTALDSLRETVGPDALAEIIESYLQQSGDLVELVKKGVRTRDLEQAGRAAHSLLSPSKMLGALALANACADLDRRARTDITQKQAERLGSQIEKLHAAFIKTLR